MTSRPRWAMVALVAANLLWAGTYVAGKTALHSLTPVELNACRFALAGLIFLPFLYRYRGALRPDRRAALRLALLCLLGFVLNKAAEFSGLRLTSASDTALLIVAEGLFTAIFGWVLLRETVRRASIAGLLLSVVGVYLVVERGLVLPRLGGSRVLGDLLVLGALVFEALYTVLGKAELRRHPGLVITAACVIGSLVVWVPAAIVNMAVAGLPAPDGGAWVGLTYLALAGTVLAYVAWIVGLRYVPASTAAPILFLQPPVGALLAVVLLHERLQWPALVGGALIVGGIWIVSRGERQAEEIVTGAEVLS